MIKIYTTPSCSSCRKAKSWLDEHNIPYEEKNIFAYPITKDDIKLILKNTENGFEDIISTRSKYLHDNNIDIEELKYSELEQLIMEQPSILKRPIIVEDNKLQIGYNEDDIRIFIPKELRKMMMLLDCDNCNQKEDIKRFYYEQIGKKN